MLPASGSFSIIPWNAPSYGCRSCCGRFCLLFGSAAAVLATMRWFATWTSLRHWTWVSGMLLGRCSFCGCGRGHGTRCFVFAPVFAFHGWPCYARDSMSRRGCGRGHGTRCFVFATVMAFHGWPRFARDRMSRRGRDERRGSST